MIVKLDLDYDQLDELVRQLLIDMYDGAAMDGDPDADAFVTVLGYMTATAEHLEWMISKGLKV